MNRQHSKGHRAAFAIVLGGCLLMAVTGCSDGERPGVAPADAEAIKAADQAYATAWLTGDPGQVMATLTEDAVIVPSGIPAIDGADEIRNFWWPADSPPTTVTGFTLVQQEAGGSGAFGFVRGSFSLEFEYDANTFSNSGDYISLLRRLPDGSWRIFYRLWNDHPPQVTRDARQLPSRMRGVGS